MLKKGDVILLLIIAFSMIVVFIAGNGSLSSISSWKTGKSENDIVAVLKKDDVIIRTIDLSKLKKREVIKISGQYEATIIVENNKIRFLESTCPDKICVKTGWISKPGEVAVCLPNKTLIKIRQQNSYSLDGVVR